LRMTLEGVRGVPDGSYAFSAPTTGAPLDVVLVTGEQDAGKTSLLRTLAAAKEAIGSYGAAPDPERIRRQKTGRCRVVTTWLLSDADCVRSEVAEAQQVIVWEIGDGSSSLDASPRVRRLFGAYSSDPAQGKFELFPANRSLVFGEPPGARRPTPDPAEGRLRMTSAPEKYAGLRVYLRDLVLADAGRLSQALATQGIAIRTRQPDALGPMREAIALVLQNVRLANVEPDDRSARVFFHKRDGTLVELEDLSSSEQQAVLFATTFQRFGLNRSVVLVDSPELYVHPRRQADFFAAVVGLGHDNQIIAATMSAGILSAARPEQIIDLSRPRADTVKR
ncbi:MAG: AAA family ATPase, partial [Byssovorax sp.]